MKNKAVLMSLPLLASGCVALDSERNQRFQNEAMARYVASLDKRSYVCVTRPECDKAYQLVKSYVMENSDMNIQVVDSSIIVTYRPTKLHQVGLKAVRTPVEKEIEEIKLTGECTDYRVGSVGYCDHRLASIYEGLIPFIESRIK